jgi:2-C-methyl-D-erythritol 4-phosphate cytidylyltransferase
MTVAAIVAAGGQGRRIGADTPKQFMDIAGRTMLERTVDAFLRHPSIHEVVVVLPADTAAPASFSGSAKPLKVVVGGARRQDSVAAGFSAIGDRVDLVVVHDGARPFVDSATIDRTIEAASRSGAAIAAVRASDTIKEADPHDPARVGRTLRREAIWLAQTPQAFARHVLADAIRLGQSGGLGTDEAALAQQGGHTLLLV